MAGNTQIWRMARLLGQEEFLSCLSLASIDDLHGLDADQLAKVRQCTLDNVNRITRSLVHDAASRDDVVTAADAERYLEQRVSELGELLSYEARQKMCEGYRLLTARWGS